MRTAIRSVLLVGVVATAGWSFGTPDPQPAIAAVCGLFIALYVTSGDWA